MFKKLLCCLAVFMFITLGSVVSFAQPKSVPLAKYLKPVQLDSLDLILLAADMMYRDELSQKRMVALTEAFNKEINKGVLDKRGVDLSKLDIFNYNLNYIDYDDSTKKIEIRFDISEIVNIRPFEAQKQFFSSCFDRLIEILSSLIPEFDEKRDLYVEFYSWDNPEKRIARYENGSYIF